MCIRDRAKIGVLVADVSGEEAQGFRSYYENYIAGNYDVEFNYTDALQSACLLYTSRCV